MAAAAAVKELASQGEMEAAMKDPSPMVIHFWASWCPASSHMDSVISQLSIDMPSARFFRVEAEEVPEVSEYFGVSVVPFFAFLKDCKVVDKLEGANPAELANKISQLAGPSSQIKSAAPASLGMAAGPAVLEAVRDLARDNDGLRDSKQSFTLTDSLKSRIQDMVDKNPVILFMKGTPEQPQCGFSKKVVAALTELGVSFGSFDILSDDHIRQGLKIYSNWPTFPQLYCKGELLGGCDITLEMYKSGELKQVFEEKGVLEKEDKTKLEVVGKEDKEGELKSRLNSLINSKPVLLFMKGSPDEPRCGFSRKTVEALRAEGLTDFGSFDILSDDEVRQGMKTYSNWPTFPQLYINGEFIGGCDIVTEMHKNGELKQLLSELSEGSLENRLKKLIDSSPVMLFMKGTPEAPRCGFSSKVVSILKGEGIEFGSFDITSDDEVRQGLKTYSNWPTYPQLYCKGELIGGCDIILEMQKNDELKMLKSDPS